VTALSFSPDGDTLAIGFSDNGIDLWSVSAQKFISGPDQSTQVHSHGQVTSVAFSPNGDLLAWGSTDQLVRVWKVRSQGPPQVLSGHTAAVLCVAFSAADKGKILASGGADNQIILWDPESGKSLKFLEGHSSAVNTLTFSPHSAVLVSGGDDGTVRFWDTAGFRLSVTLAPIYNGVDWLATTPDGFFDGSEDTWSEVLWQFNRDLFDVSPVEIGFRDYFFPNLLARILDGKPPTAARSLASLNRAQPIVRIVSVKPDSPNTVCVTVEARNGTSSMQRDAAGHALESGVYDVRLFRNGHLTPQPHSPGETESGGNLAAWRGAHLVRLNPDGTKLIRFAGIQLAHWSPSGTNAFTAYAFNLDRVKSATSPPFNYTAQTANRPVRRAWLVTMGVNDNQVPTWGQDIAVPSAKLASSTLSQKLNGSYRVIDVPLYSDYSDHGRGLARKGMLQAVLDLLGGRKVAADLRQKVDAGNQIERATPDDLVVLYIASHGVADPQGNLHLVPYDTGAEPVTMSELTRCFAHAAQPSCVDATNFLHSTISSDELSDWWESIDAEQAILVIDSCHSGAITGSSFRPAPLGDPGLGQLSYDKRMFLLAAAQAAQTVPGDLNVGTTFLAEALKTVSQDHPERSVTDWLREVNQELPALEKQGETGFDEVQTPVLLDFADPEHSNSASPSGH
jgi:hypothetical protein